ncbi:DNA repair protein rad51d [Sorochytrium milnesiophthora]
MHTSLNPFEDAASTHVEQRLAALGICTDQRLIRQQARLRAQFSGAHLHALEHFIAVAASHAAAPCVSARVLLSRTQERPSLTTGYEKMLGGGLHAGEVVEFSGSAGVGKSRFCYQLLARNLTSETTALYIDSMLAFSPADLAEECQRHGGEWEQAWRAHLWLQRGWTLTNMQMLRRVRVVSAVSISDLLLTLEHTLNALESRTSDAFHGALRLVVVDSMAGYFAHRVGDYRERSHFFAREVMSRLKRMASEFGVLVVTTSMAVAVDVRLAASAAAPEVDNEDDGEDDGDGDDEGKEVNRRPPGQRQLKPGLGYTWRFHVDTQIVMTRQSPAFATVTLRQQQHTRHVVRFEIFRDKLGRAGTIADVVV